MVTVNPDTTTTYIIISTITGGGGCASTDSVTVFVEVSPEDDYSDTICLGDEITLDAIITGATYLWSNGATTQTITTSDSGWFDVTIFVDTAICEYFKHFHVVGQTCSVELPNVFTPNGDTENDVFTSFTPGAYDQFSVTIYNRWGREIFESTDPNFAWDGKTKGGAEAKAGTYFYIVQTTLNGVTEKKTGTVTLIR
jgi:gliding motility-associated-like protein